MNEVEPGAVVVRRDASDLSTLEQVVTIGFPTRAAQAFLARHLVNPVRLKLVEAARGEPVERVRCVEVVHASGDRTWVRAHRQLDDGRPAGAFAPPGRVHAVPVVEGAAASSRSLEPTDTVVLHVPVDSLLRHLPAIYQGAGPIQGAGPTSEDPLRQFLLLFQHVFRSATEPIGALPQLTEPSQTPASLLPWLASWVGRDLDATLPVHQQRELVRRAVRLARTRGTRAGIESLVHVLTGAPARIEERTAPAAFVLGRGHLGGGTTVVERFTTGEPPGAVLGSGAPFAPTRFFTLWLGPRSRFAERFGARAPEVLQRIVRIVTAEVPSHLRFVIRFEPAE